MRADLVAHHSGKRIAQFALSLCRIDLGVDLCLECQEWHTWTVDVLTQRLTPLLELRKYAPLNYSGSPGESIDLGVFWPIMFTRTNSQHFVTNSGSFLAIDALRRSSRLASRSSITLHYSYYSRQRLRQCRNEESSKVRCLVLSSPPVA